MSGSFEHISECRMAVCHAVLETGMQGHGDIEIFWLSDYVLNWPTNSVHCAADHFYVSTGIENDFRDVFSFNPPITGCHHLMGAREVGPQLQAPQATVCPAFRHLLVDYSATGGHPLHFASADSPLIPHACLLYTSDAADDLLCVDLGGRRIIKK